MSCRWYIKRSFCATDSLSAVCRNAASGSCQHFLPKSLHFSRRNSELLTLDLLLSTANNSSRWTAVLHREPHPRPRWPESYRRSAADSYAPGGMADNSPTDLLGCSPKRTTPFSTLPNSTHFAEFLPPDLQLFTAVTTTPADGEPHPRHAAWCNYARLVCSEPYGSTFVCISTSQLPAHVYAHGGVADSAALSCSHHHWRSPRLYYGYCYPALDSAASHGGPLCSHLSVVRCRSW